MQFSEIEVGMNMCGVDIGQELRTAYNPKSAVLLNIEASANSKINRFLIQQVLN